MFENGLLVKFCSVFEGFIFQDHLEKPLDKYKKNEIFEARIIQVS